MALIENGTKIEVHYFRNTTTGQVFNVKTKYNFGTKAHLKI